MVNIEPVFLKIFKTLLVSPVQVKEVSPIPNVCGIFILETASLIELYSTDSVSSSSASLVGIRDVSLFLPNLEEKPDLDIFLANLDSLSMPAYEPC